MKIYSENVLLVLLILQIGGEFLYSQQLLICNNSRSGIDIVIVVSVEMTFFLISNRDQS